MTAALAEDLTLAALLSADWTVGEPDVVGALAVFPLFGGSGDEDVGYLTFAQATERGAVAKELPTGPVVSDIVVHNPTGSMVLLVDGEEVLGAQQNRVFDGSVLVPAGGEMQVAVCCVEQGRWQSSKRAEAFRGSPQVSHPGLRRALVESRHGSTGRGSQSAVWSHVSELAERTGTVTSTGAMSHVYVRRRRHLAESSRAVRLRHEQRGAVAFAGGRFLALDWLASAASYADMHRRLVRGYALEVPDRLGADEASSRRTTPTPTPRDVQALVAHLGGLPVELGDEAGAGRRMGVARRDDATRWRVSGLAHEGRLVQVSVLRAA